MLENTLFNLYLVINGFASPATIDTEWDGVDSVLVAADSEKEAVQIADIYKNEYFTGLFTEVSVKGTTIDVVTMDVSDSDLGMRLEDAFAAGIGQDNYEKLLKENWFPFDGGHRMELPDGRVHCMSLVSRNFWTESFEKAVADEVREAKEFLENLDYERATFAADGEKMR